MNHIPTIGGEPRQHQPTSLEITMAKWESLCRLWQAYGEFVLKSDFPDRQTKAENAFGKAAKYVHKLISQTERTLGEK